MKKFTKLFLSVAAVTVVTAAVATSAMAAEKTLTASYATDEGGATGTVAITCDSQDETKTLLILKPGSDRTNVKAADILQIDQNANITTAKVPALSEEVEADKGTYTVLMGGTSGDIYVGSFSIGGEPILLGDVDGKAGLDTRDSNAILYWAIDEKPVEGKSGIVGKTINLADGTTMLVGDVDGKVGLDTRDSNAILYWAIDEAPVEGKSGVVGNTVVGTIVDTPVAE